jgi:hypothetical protein
VLPLRLGRHEVAFEEHRLVFLQWTSYPDERSPEVSLMALSFLLGETDDHGFST